LQKVTFSLCPLRERGRERERALWCLFFSFSSGDWTEGFMHAKHLSATESHLWPWCLFLWGY
jgi:hypothetical protein